MRKLRKRKITKFLSIAVFDDRESEYCPFLIEETDSEKQNWLTLKEARNLQFFLNESIDRLTRLYAESPSADCEVKK